MGKLGKCDIMYGEECISKDITKALSYGTKPEQSIAFSLSAISKTLYNIMMMIDLEDKK